MSGNAFSRRREMELIFMSGKKVTTQELMYKFEVGRNTIRKDIDFLSLYLPITSKQGYGGGYYLAERYSRFQNSLTKEQLECLKVLQEICPEEEIEVLESIIQEFGPYSPEKSIYDQGRNGRIG